MYVYIGKGKELNCSNNLCSTYLKHGQYCLTHHLHTEELINLARLLSKAENESEPAQEQTKGMVSFLHA